MAGIVNKVETGAPGGRAVVGNPVVLVPFYSAIEKECEDGLRALVAAGIALSRFSLSSIDLCASAMLSDALARGFDQFLFIDADIGFDPADALRILRGPSPWWRGSMCTTRGATWQRRSRRG